MLNEENEFGGRVSSSAFQSPPSRTSLESSASKSLCILHTRVTISIANRQSSTCFIWSGKPKALGGHASSTRAESASRLLVSNDELANPPNVLAPLFPNRLDVSEEMKNMCEGSQRKKDVLTYSSKQRRKKSH